MDKEKIVCTLGSHSQCIDQPVPEAECRKCGWEAHECERRKDVIRKYGLALQPSGLYGYCEPRNRKDKQNGRI